MLLSNWLLALRNRPLSRRGSRPRRLATPALCESLEERILLSVVAQNDSYQLQHDTTLNQSAPGVLSNDFIMFGGGTLTASLISGPSHADSFQLNSNGSFDYVPDEHWAGTDSFTYQATNGSSSDTATVTLTIKNFAPAASNDSYNVVFDTFDTDVLGYPSVLGNDQDMDSDPLTAELVSGPSHGSLTLNSDGSLSTRRTRTTSASIRSLTRQRMEWQPTPPRSRSTSARPLPLRQTRSTGPAPTSTGTASWAHRC